jgi:hypothetical protein
MKTLKQVSIVLLTLLFTLSFATSAFASAGKDYAPGQSESFSKGITTKVIVTEDVQEKTLHKKDVSFDTKTEKKEKSYTKKPVVTKDKTKEYHKKHNWYRYVTTTKTDTTTVHKTWDEVTKTKTTKFIEIPVTITKKTVTTIKHRGAPGSNGKKISETTETFTDKVKGKPKVTDTKKEVLSVKKKNHDKKEDTKTTTEVKKGKWIKGKK